MNPNHWPDSVQIIFGIALGLFVVMPLLVGAVTVGYRLGDLFEIWLEERKAK